MAKLKFQPKIRKPGELILAEDWNNMQTEIKDDLSNLKETMGDLEKRSNVIIASGIASHGLYIQLKWDVTPHVMVSLSGTVAEPKGKKRFRCFPYDISPDGFSVHALSEDGEEGIVNWLSIGVV